MENINKVSLLKELEFYSRLLEKHEALKKEKELKTLISQQASISQQFNKPKSLHTDKVVKNQNNPVSCFNQNYLCKKSTHLGIADQNKRNGLYNQRQSYISKYSLSKNEFLKHASPISNFTINRKTSSVLAKSITDSKSGSIKVPCVSSSSNKSEESSYNTKDFIKEVESLTELLKKKTSENPLKNINSASKCGNAVQSKEFSLKKSQNSSFDTITFMKKETTFSKTKFIVQKSSRMPSNVNYANKRNVLISSNKYNSPQQKSLNAFVYNKNNVKLLNGTATSLRNVTEKSRGGFQKSISRPASRKVIVSDSKNFSHNLSTSENVGILQIKPLSFGTREVVMKLHTPPKIISSNRKVVKKSPYFTKIKSPVLFKTKPSNAVKAPKIIKQKQTNTRYQKINKHLITPDRIQLQQPSQQKFLSKRIKKKVNKYKVINKTVVPSSSDKTANTLCSPVSKNTSLSTDCDSFLENLNNSAVDKLEQNLLTISSELTAPLLSEKNKVSNNKVLQHSLVKASSKLDCKKTFLKKSKVRISKYKIINLNVSQKFSSKNIQSIHMVTPAKRERAVLVRRLYKSKNVIVNKNATPTNYSAKMIKSKYLSLNKRKSSSWQKYISPTVSLHPKYKGSFSATKLHPKQKRFKTNVGSAYQSRLIRKTNYGCQIYRNKLVYSNNARKVRNKINNRYAHSPVVCIRGTRYATNLNGKTLRKLPMKGSTAKSFQRASGKLILRTPDNLIKASSSNLASRVLHRSINRILTASSKKNLAKVNTYCMFYNRFGRCNRGVKCSYIHDPNKIAVCTRFLRGTCKIDGCPFSHEIDPGKMAICSFFLVGLCDKENCPYRHEKLLPNAILCKDFVQGYCHNGKECKKAHILICPKYMQGECDKGSSCSFPHPPQKEKKNNQKEVEDEEPKPTEALLEKVLRYFQQGGDSQNESHYKSTINLFVPKRMRLEEQPSFIPLSASPAVSHNDK